jgi:LysR family hca operon transcriptional activator
MELRHLRYFIAVAEEGSLTNAAERRLHTAQPSLSRQIRDLELSVGAKLLDRGARGIALTAAGRVFLDHARLALLQVEAAGEAARRAAQPEKAAFVFGFLTGHEVVWLPQALRILREEQPDIEITLFSQSSPELAGGLMRGKVDVAFLRREAQAPGLAFKFLIKEPLVAVLPAGHRLAARKDIRLQEFAGETYITPTRVAPALKAVIDAYAAKSGVQSAVGRRCHSPVARAAADHRPGHGLQQGEHLAAAQAISGTRGRTGRARVAKWRLTDLLVAD